MSKGVSMATAAQLLRIVHKDLRKPVRAAVDAGWSLTQGGKHLKLTAPDGSYATPLVQRSGSSGKLVAAIRQRLAAHGVEW